MSNRINPYQALRINAYEQAGQRSGIQGRRPAEADAQVDAAQGNATVERARSTSAASPGDLTVSEQKMINRYFPPSEKMSLRIYGPNRAAQVVNPGALGTRIDISG